MGSCVSSRPMNQRHEDRTRDPGREPGSSIVPLWIIEEMREEMERGKALDQIRVLEGIREEFGIGWAIYAAGFMGPEIEEWRADVCEALR